MTSGEDSYINLIDVETLKRKMSVTGHADWVTCLSVNNIAKSFVTGSLDNTIKVWDLNSGKCLKTMDQKAPVWGASFSPSGEHIVTVTQDGSVTLISLKL